MRSFINMPNIPEYHDGMLLVRSRTDGPANLAMASFASSAMAVAFDPGAISSSIGISALSFYERAGLIKRVVPVARVSDPDIDSSFAAAAAPAGMRTAAALMLSTGFASGDAQMGLASGLSLIELEREEDRERVQLALAGDPNFSAVSRVPVRYFTAGKRQKPVPEDVTPHPIGPAATPPNPTMMWNLRKIQWEQARSLPGFVDADGIDVAVLDTGIDTGHPDLHGRIADYVYAHPDLPAASSVSDIIGHGTHVSGTIAALINNGLGINGICSCGIHSWKIFDDRPDLVRGAFSRFAYFVDPVMYIRALLDCISVRPHVLNLSIGGSGRPSQAESEAFQQIIANGTIVVAAMGNERQQGSPISYPAAIPGVIAVGATGLTDRVTNFSNRGSHITLCAPGDAIWSTLPTYPGQLGFEAIIGPDGRARQGKPQRRETDYDAWPGTSMAAPHVTAAIALYLANGGDPSQAAVKSALASSCDKVEAMGGVSFNADYGHGRLNLSTLLQHARANLQPALAATS